MIEIDPAGDLIVKVIETETIEDDTVEHGTTADDEGSQRVPSRTEDFRVRRDILRKASTVWRKMLSSDVYIEGRSTFVQFHDNPILSTEILLRALHNAEDPSTYEASIVDVWRLVGIVNFWQLKIEFLYPWFGKWYESQKYDTTKLDVLEQRQLLFPCWRFQHAQGFAAATRFLAYNCSKHIEEDNPLEYDNLHLPSRIISQLNAAKGRLRTIVHRELYKPIKDLLGSTCKCKGDTLWGYEKALTTARVWPLEDVGRYTTMQLIIERLQKFTYKVAANACMRCHSGNYNMIALRASEVTRDYFNGLCLDCMARKNPKLRDHDDDYWNHSKFRFEDGWFKNCRVPHKQPTWYYSFMGRQEVRDRLQKREERPYDSDDDNL